MKKFIETNNQLRALFTFANFTQAIDFVNLVADLAETANHHPDILIHDYKNVTITLTTHDQNRVTQKDWDLAGKIEALS